ncbi:hypothetical protein ANCDUO_16614 [Ancylostoma duodenale]|uniref:Uncharacterized protein n=1 Tax=Ancylostoma duodenale TaxID=51022 RepID=A0A0C2CTZ8_9BILA|nr:hypothetical protein ANCDUO_16614 [Ancylostoma duodenale]
MKVLHIPLLDDESTDLTPYFTTVFKTTRFSSPQRSRESRHRRGRASNPRARAHRRGDIALGHANPLQEIDEARKSAGRLLLLCAMGISRSATFAITYLMCIEK